MGQRRGAVRAVLGGCTRNHRLCSLVRIYNNVGTISNTLHGNGSNSVSISKSLALSGDGTTSPEVVTANVIMIPR